MAGKRSFTMSTCWKFVLPNLKLVSSTNPITANGSYALELPWPGGLANLEIHGDFGGGTLKLERQEPDDSDNWFEFDALNTTWTEAATADKNIALTAGGGAYRVTLTNATAPSLRVYLVAAARLHSA